jgi:hypothetical protein
MIKLSSNLAASMSAVLALVVSIGVFTTVRPAIAISVELANKCRQMAITSHPPPIPPGNKAYAAAERSLFQECVAKNGKMKDDGSPHDDGTPKDSDGQK